MIGRRLLSSIHLVLCLGATCAAQSPYTVGHYLRDRTIAQRADSAYQPGDIDLALTLHKTLRDRSPGTSFWRAQLVWAAGGSPEAELAEAFNRGFRYVPNVPPDSFEIANAERISELESVAAGKRDGRRIQRCEALITRDQELAMPPIQDLIAHARNVDTLDQLIREGGWPSSHPLVDNGVAIVLAHQRWDEAHRFTPYQTLIEAECLVGREDWMVAIFTLQQRIRYTARNKTDTIAFTNLALADDDPALPMIVAISHRLTSNGQRRVWIHATDSTTALSIAQRIVQVQPRITIPRDVLEMLKERSMDRPGPLSMERIKVVVDPTLTPDRFLYRMN